MTQSLPLSDGERQPLLTALHRLRDHLRHSGLDGELPVELWERALFGPATEMLARPGKLFRGRLTELVARGARSPATTVATATPDASDATHGAPATPPEPPAVPPELAWIVELVHTGSLIVDDVQDSSGERRGGPALHRMIGVPLAINTGNWLYFAALSLVEEVALPPATRAAILRATVTALMRCHHGQALDLAIHVGHLEPRQLPAVVAATTRNKTGVLMGLAARLGALAAGAGAGSEDGACDAQVEALARFGEELGVGLQMLDDLGSLCAPARRDKGQEDLRAGRPTWPWAWLAEKTDDLKVARQQQRLRTALAHRDTVELSALGDELASATLEHGRAALRAQLARAMSLGKQHLNALVHRELAAELARLEASYG